MVRVLNSQPTEDASAGMPLLTSRHPRLDAKLAAQQAFVGQRDATCAPARLPGQPCMHSQACMRTQPLTTPFQTMRLATLLRNHHGTHLGVIGVERRDRLHIRPCLAHADGRAAAAAALRRCRLAGCGRRRAGGACGPSTHGAEWQGHRGALYPGEVRRARWVSGCQPHSLSDVAMRVEKFWWGGKGACI